MASNSIRVNTIPPPLAGFEDVSRSYARDVELVAAKLLPGEVYVTVRDEAIRTTLGSCVAACIRDTTRGVGGMNHFMLPEGSEDNDWGKAARYGNYAMELLINSILTSGGKRHRLEAKIFGGARMFGNRESVGADNIRFVESYLANESIPVVAEDVGEVFPRQVVFFPQSGRARVRRLESVSRSQVEANEKRYRKVLEQDNWSGDIELF